MRGFWGFKTFLFGFYTSGSGLGYSKSLANLIASNVVLVGIKVNFPLRILVYDYSYLAPSLNYILYKHKHTFSAYVNGCCPGYELFWLVNPPIAT